MKNNENRPTAGRPAGSTRGRKVIANSISLPIHLWEEIDQKCQEKGISRAEYFRNLVEKSGAFSAPPVAIINPAKTEQPLLEWREGDVFPKGAHIGLDCEKEEIYAETAAEKNSVPAAVFYEKILWWPISPYIKRERLEALLEEIAPLAGKICAGYEERIVGSNLRGTFDKAAQEARTAISHLVFKISQETPEQ